MTATAFTSEFKTCPVCLDRFYRPRSCSPSKWAPQITCSVECALKRRAGKIAKPPVETRPSPAYSSGWRSQAACNAPWVDSEIFFPLSNDWKGRIDNVKADEAKAICRRCPSRQACLDDALVRGDAWAILGATTPGERRMLSLAMTEATS